MPLFMLQIDGSYGEGGGQIIRSAVALSAITGTAIQIRSVRAGRSRPGLQPQHLMAVKAAAQLCGAKTDGAAVGSTAFSFQPTKAVAAGSFQFDIGTAGSTSLVLQTVLWPLAMAGGSSEVVVIGGTHNPHAPTAEFMEHVYLPALRQFGLNAEYECVRFGFYPAGSGEARLRLSPSTLLPIDLRERTGPVRTRVMAISGKLPTTVADRGLAVAEKMLKGVPYEWEAIEKESRSSGAAMAVIAEAGVARAGFSGLGERGKPMERVAEEACEQYLAWAPSGAAVDEHLADQLVLPAILATGTSQWTSHVASEHLWTVLWLVHQLRPISHEIREEGGRALVAVSRA